MTINERSLLPLLLCSHLGLPDDGALKPFTTREWNDFELKLDRSSIDAGAAVGMKTGELAAMLDSNAEEAQRITGLFGRRGELEAELDRLASLDIWVLTRFDEDYPPRLLQRLRNSAPVFLHGSGDPGLLRRGGLAVVGSRNVDPRGFTLTEFIGNACAESRMVVISGGARGVDKTAMGAALVAGGSAVGMLADSLEKARRATDARAAVEDGKLTLATSFSPGASFSVGLAMARNKLIYALADFGLIIASDAEKGGTWAGAEEALKARWIPVFVVDGPGVPDGNKRLIEQGGLSFPAAFDDSPSSLKRWLMEHSPTSKPVAVQGSLFQN
jgi:predicted Rossmann fold nucleotide-binding protein DprA/Smf involved in DNA uptake